MWLEITVAGVVIAVTLHIYSYRKKYSVENKVALITGASGGIGEAFAHELCKSGVKVILAARSIKNLTRVQEDLKKMYNQDAAIVQMDLGDFDGLPGKVKEAIAVHGRLDILINNAGVSSRGDCADINMEALQLVMNTNYLGQVVVTQVAVEHMIGRGSGHVLSVSSLQGRFALPHRSAYGASKHAIQAFMDSLRAELVDTGVHVLVVSPGYTRTQLSANAVTASGDKHGDANDPELLKGMSAESVAKASVAALQRGWNELLLGPWHHRFVVTLRAVWPSLFFFIMSRRAKSST